MQTYGKHTALSSMVMFGGVNINPQISALKKPLDILVATPGRLLDHCGQRTIDLSGVEILVLDEADRMLDMGFIRDIRKILALLPQKRQNLLFSATFSDEIRSLARGVLNNPGEVSVTRATPPPNWSRRPCTWSNSTTSATSSATSSAKAAGTRCWCSRAPSTAPTAWPSWSRTA